MIISIQGSMAVGKTALVTYLKDAIPKAVLSYEDITPIVSEVKERALDKNKFEDYLEIQKLWIAHEIQRYQKVRDFPLVLMDFGAEEIDFYTRFYPQAAGYDWNPLPFLENELTQLSYCLPDHIIFLEAEDEVLQQRKASDKTRSRNFFDFQLEKLLPLKRKWFAEKENVIFLDTNGLSREEVGQKTADLIRQMLAEEK
jgi:thymidylate kinase